MAKFIVTNYVTVPVEFEMEAENTEALVEMLNNKSITEQDIRDSVGVDDGRDEVWHVTDEEGNSFRTDEIAV